MRRYYAKRPIKDELLKVLGSNKCQNINCCVPGGMSDKRCLQFDHINGGGNVDKKRFKTNIEMYKYYIAHPEEAKQKLQVLCANCNWIKRDEKKEILIENYRKTSKL